LTTSILAASRGLTGRSRLLVDFADLAFVLLGPLLRLFELRGEALHLRVHLTDFATHELLGRTGGGPGGEHGERNDEQYLTHG